MYQRARSASRSCLPSSPNPAPRLLRDRRLQAALRDVDGSGDREGALRVALDGDEALRGFATTLLDMVDQTS